MGKGFLSGAVLFTATAALLLPVVPAAAAYDPMAFSQGVWQGKADNGREKFTVTVTVKKVGRNVFGSYRAQSLSGQKANGSFKAFPEGAGRKLEIKDSTLQIKFEVRLTPKSGTELDVSSFMGGGAAKFFDDFTRCNISFHGMGNNITVTLHRVSPPPPARKKAGGKQGVKKAPYMPPMVIVSP
ncbi:MAG: hypothetical protein A2021_08135 [Elusimicrobia bacterium GWF2_52_66]|nr:MAG: hypothetical protein A2X33_05675 [Elusimicrobia bacterium GWA2_51_34]OGR85488.1 MAG: hypothetical protein A2021_08135 [Elusimicrobia bacterium GWF2_52_66]HAF94972.1 hypothetical protein [Elusimicrobiota bacterium]HCE99118.1 hypothetical protein [Elusimicrobiota bacterium]